MRLVIQISRKDIEHSFGKKMTAHEYEDATNLMSELLEGCYDQLIMKLPEIMEKVKNGITERDTTN